MRQVHGLPRDLVKNRPLRARDVQAYQSCELLTEGLIYLMVVFSPWAFGTSQPWSIWVMNCAGYSLGGMLAVKLVIRRLKDYHPPRWEETRGVGQKAEDGGRRTEDGEREGEGCGGESRRQEGEVRSPKSEVRNQDAVVRPPSSALRPPAPVLRGPHFSISPRPASRLTAALAGLTVAILGYCLLSALNARATYDPDTLSFAYHDGYIPWLPHSFDSTSTWFTFWSYLGLALSFWAIRDWLLGKSAAEQRLERQATRPGGTARADSFPARLRRLFWLLAINGGLVGLEGIIQRLEGSGELLFLVRPRLHPTADTQFGPYAYYANASQYFNLLWPGCLGFWWMLHRSRGFRRHRHHLVLVCGAIMAACPIISTSRGGTLVTVANLLLAAFLLTTTHFLFPDHRQANRRRRLITLCVLAAFFAGALALGYSLGWKALKPRMAELSQGFQGREREFDRARPLAADYPVFGTGPGTFATVSQLYRNADYEFRWVQLHNDWLETRITFGWVGSALIALALATVLLRWFVPGGIHGGRRFVLLMWLALGGCLVHARFDFPFQMHSIVFLFLILCATLFILSRRPSVH